MKNLELRTLIIAFVATISIFWTTGKWFPETNGKNENKLRHWEKSGGKSHRRRPRQSGVAEEIPINRSRIESFYELSAASHHFLEPSECEPDVQVVVLVRTTMSQNFRPSARDVWNSPENKNTIIKYRTIFVVEALTPINKYAFMQLEQENKEYGDILLAYSSNLTNRRLTHTLLGMTWTMKHCPSAEFVVSIKDTMIGDVSGLFKNSLFTFRGKSEKILAGKILRWKPSPQLDRTFSDVQLSVGNGYPFCSPDNGYILSIAAVQEVLNWSLIHSQYAQMYDIYLGLLGETYGWRMINVNLFA